MRGFTLPPCMAQTTPQQVLQAVSSFIDQYTPPSWEKLDSTKLCPADHSSLFVMGDLPRQELINLSKAHPLTVLTSRFTNFTETTTNIAYIYGNLYNQPFEDNTLGDVLWYPQTNSPYQLFGFSELLRILKPQATLWIKSDGLSPTLREILQVSEKVPLYVAIRKKSAAPHDHYPEGRS